MITIIITYVWRAPDVFTKGHSSTSANVPKNLTADVFNKHFPLCVRIINRAENNCIIMNVLVFCVIFANKNLAGK